MVDIDYNKRRLFANDITASFPSSGTSATCSCHYIFASSTSYTFHYKRDVWIIHCC
jgi:hypothetical protein